MRPGWFLLALAALLWPPVQQQSRPPAVRLHHLHFSSDDPAGAMADVVGAMGGTRAIAPGLGAGVRLDDVYVLFDRPDPSAATRSLRAEAAVAAAERWFAAQGVEVQSSAAGRKMLAAVLPDQLDHVAFAADDVLAIEGTLRKSGAEPVRRRGESTFYLAGDTLVELTAETERADRFWCPMHPHVRSFGPRTCPICSMALVAIAPPRVGEYRLDVTQVPERRGGGVRALKLRVRDPDSRTDVAMFAEAHERLLHLFIVGRDLQFFAHEHPVRTGDGFELDVALPAGAYMLIADFLPGGGYPQMVHRAIVTPGFRASAFKSVPLREDLDAKTVDGMRVQVTVHPAEARPAAGLQFTVTDTAGAPIADLEPYLGSAGHLLVVSADLTHSIHSHPEAARAPGPDLAFDVEFPEAGAYKLWLQVQRRGKVSAVPFVVRIRK